jgi:hypothetical protein
MKRFSKTNKRAQNLLSTLLKDQPTELERKAKLVVV